MNDQTSPRPIIGRIPTDDDDTALWVTATRIAVERDLTGESSRPQEAGVYFDVTGPVPGLDFDPTWCYVDPDEPDRIQWHAVGHPVGRVVIPAVLDEAARILRLHGVEVTR